MTAAPDPDDAAFAWRNGVQAVRAENLWQAWLWLQRARRLAPNDPRITLELAGVLTARGGADQLTAAIAEFAQLADRYDIFAAYAGLATACHLAGDYRQAAAALNRLLRRHCLPDPADPGFCNLAGLAATAAGVPGWCGALASDLLFVHAPDAPDLTFRLDGRRVRLRRQNNGHFIIPQAGDRLEIAATDLPLLGSPLDLPALRRVEGLVDYDETGLTGWASRPAAPQSTPLLTLQDAGGARLRVAFGDVLPADEAAPFLCRHAFFIPQVRLRRLTPPFRLAGPAGAAIFGSPADPAILAIAPVAATAIRKKISRLPKRRALAVVVPVYRGLLVTQACLAALFAAVPARTKIIVVDDATPDPALASWLDALAAAGRIILHRHPKNLGFPAAANTGIGAAGRRDVLLLNSDTLVPPGAIETMLAIAYADAATGSVTPFSNAATIMNYPDPSGDNPAPDLAETDRLNRLAWRANGQRGVPVPTGIGFCMLLRHDCIAATGLFRPEIFAQGYGEENDFSLRASQAGYRHMAAAGAFVAHLGGASFRTAGRALNARNAGRLNRLYPGYDAMIQDFIARDPLRVARRKFDIARFQAGRAPAGGVLLISHHHGGGVARRVAAEMTAIRAAGERPILLFPAAPADPLNTPFPWDAQLTDGATGDYPNLRFKLPAETADLQRLLARERIVRVVLHHGLGHHDSVRDIAGRLNVPQSIVIHDYSSFCLRVNLLSRARPEAPLRYCGEPNVNACVACVAANGDATFGTIGVRDVIARSQREFAAAAAIAAPSADAARRIARHFPGVKVDVTPWEDDQLPVQLMPPKPGRRRVVIIGGIGPAKGFDVLIDCARDATARDLALEFIVAGASAEDGKLLETGRIFVTGAYAEGEATALIRSLAADLAFLPSIWPETWCFALGEAWRAGLYTISFDLGAQAARIRATGRGALLPLGLPAPRINDALLAWQANLRNSGVAG